MTASVWWLEVPFAEDGLPPLTANKRLHWAVQNRRTREIKDAVGWRAKARMPRNLEHITVQLVYQPQDRRRRDPSNLMPTQKAALDALVEVGVVRDDTPEFVTEQIPTVLEPDGGDRGLWLVVESTPLESPTVRRWIDEESRFERTQDAAGGDQP
jgi:crossover junction endodeoxyribonuclease RusA